MLPPEAQLKQHDICKSSGCRSFILSCHGRRGLEAMRKQRCAHSMFMICCWSSSILGESCRPSGLLSFMEEWNGFLERGGWKGKDMVTETQWMNNNHEE